MKLCICMYHAKKSCSDGVSIPVIKLVPIKLQEKKDREKFRHEKANHRRRYGLMLLIGLAFSANVGAMIGFWVSGGQGVFMGGMPIVWVASTAATWMRSTYNDAVRMSASMHVRLLLL